MKKLIVGIIVCASTLSLLCGCASHSPAKDDLSSIQGSWNGSEMGAPGECHMTITGDMLKFQGAHQEEWYDAKLVLFPAPDLSKADVVIQNCPSQQYIGKTARGIYRLEGKTLTIAACEPGDETRPTSLDGKAPGARTFVFTRQ